MSATADAFDAAFARAVALRQARRVDRRPDEINEIAAELVAAAWAGWPRFDPARGSSRAFVASCIMRAAVSLRRARNARKRGGGRAAVRLSDVFDGAPCEAITAPERLVTERLQDDVVTLVDGLCPRVRIACFEFMNRAVNGVRASRRLAPHKAELTRAFRAAGLGAVA